MSERTGRARMVAASLARLSYAVGLLVAPHAMNRRQLAAETRGNPVATMTSRAFGAAHVNLSLLSLRAALLGRDRRLAVGLNLSFDLGDLAATVLERRNGELGGGETAASVALQSASMATWLAVLASE